MDSLQNNLPKTVSIVGEGPKKIGELDRPFEWLDEGILRGKIREAVEVLRGKYGYELFQSKLMLDLKEDFIRMSSSPGSYVFIADGDATVAVTNERGQNILVEVRLPGQPYFRGRLEGPRAFAKAIELPQLLPE
jgi:hypothetical protein